MSNISDSFPLISAVVLAKNSEAYLKEALESIFHQTYPNYEVILVDGQSTDATAAIAKSYPQLRYVYQETLGLSQGRNLGIEVAKGDFIAFLDSDDRWTSDKLSLQAQALVQEPEVQYVTSWLQLFTTSSTPLRQGYKHTDLEAPRWGRTPGTLMVRRELFERIGAFDTTLAIAGDLDWFAKAQSQGIPTITLSQVLLYKRIREDSLSSKSSVNRREVMQVLKESILRQRKEKSDVKNTPHNS